MQRDPIETPYALGDANAPIPLYQGAATLRRSDGSAVTGLITLDFVWLPTPRVGFHLEEAMLPIRSETTLAYTLSLDEIHDLPPMDVFVRRVRSGTNETYTAGTTRGVVTEPRMVDRMVFLIPNWRWMNGEWIEDPDGAGGWRGRVTLGSSGWRVVLEPRRDIQALTDELDANSGYAATHLGSLEREDGASFDSSEGRRFLDGFGLFLAFARGLWTPPTLVVGFASGQLVWHEWKGLTASPWRGNLSWVSERHPQMLSDLFPGFVARWEDPEWQQSLLLAVSWLVEANPSDPAERSIVSAQAALELMGWLILVRDARVMSAKEWKEGRDKALRHLRQLLQHANVSTAFPDDLTELVNLAARERWEDGPDALVGFRNRLVHPRGRASGILSTPLMARVGLAELASWYCELALLFFCGYRGEYLNRNKLTVEPVPWA